MAGYPFPRKELAAHLKAYLPKTWRIVDSHATVDDVQTTVVKIKQMGFERLKAAPQGFHQIDFVITISAPNLNTQADDNRLAYDIQVSISSDRTTTLNPSP